MKIGSKSRVSKSTEQGSYAMSDKGLLCHLFLAFVGVIKIVICKSSAVWVICCANVDEPFRTTCNIDSDI